MVITKLFMSNAGEDVVHSGMHGTEDTRRGNLMRNHIKNLLYSEMSLLSSIISALGVWGFRYLPTWLAGWPAVWLTG